MVKLYVGNLPFSVDDEALKEIFSQAGPVSKVKVVTDAFDGRSRGFGFVEMENDDGASAAIEKFDGQDISGRTIRVDRAKDQRTDTGPSPRPQGGGGGGPRPGGSYRRW